MTDLCTGEVTAGWHCSWDRSHPEFTPHLCQQRIVKRDLTDEERREALELASMLAEKRCSELSLGSAEWLSAYRTLVGDRRL